jgi:hypothetical protein
MAQSPFRSPPRALTPESSNHSPLFIPNPLRDSSPPPPTPADPLSSNPTMKDILYLQDCSFDIIAGTGYPRIHNLFPNLNQYLQRQKETLKAYFILIPEYEYDSDLDGSCYCSMEEIEYGDFEEIKSISERHILQIGEIKVEGKKCRVKCFYNAWVSSSRSLIDISEKCPKTYQKVIKHRRS